MAELAAADLVDQPGRGLVGVALVGSLEQDPELVAAHGNSLRGIIKYLSDISDDEIVGLEIPTGKPIVYDLADDLTVVRRYYLDES